MARIENQQIQQILDSTKGRLSEFASCCQDPEIPDEVRAEVLVALAEIAQHALNLRARYVSEEAVTAIPSVAHHE